MTLCITRQLLHRAGCVFRSRNHHTLLARKNTVKLIERQPFRYLCSSPEQHPNPLETDEFEGVSPYADIDFAAITGNDPEKIQLLKKIQLEVDMLRQQGEKVPAKITNQQWMDILERDTYHNRTAHYNFLWLNEKKKIRKKVKQTLAYEEFLNQKTSELPTKKEFTTNGPIMYGLQYNTIFFRLYDTYMKQIYNLKLLYASMFNPHIIVDCSYEPFMLAKNLQNCAKQILLMWSENRDHYNPFHLVFCNLHHDSLMLSKLRKTFLSIDEPDFPFYYTPRHYLDIYPKDRLVYLTPHCAEELDKYHPEDIYIIGGFVDKNRSEPLSLAKAKKEGLRTAKFPLDRYLRWQLGIKSLTLNQSLAIMNDLKDTNDWNYAFKHVPPRKIRSPDSLQEGTAKDLEKCNHRTSAKIIREQFRRNLVYDLLLNDEDVTKHNSPPKNQS